MHNTSARMADMAKTMSLELASPRQWAELVTHLEACLAGVSKAGWQWTRACDLPEEMPGGSAHILCTHTHHTAAETQHLMVPK